MQRYRGLLQVFNLAGAEIKQATSTAKAAQHHQQLSLSQLLYKRYSVLSNTFREEASQQVPRDPVRQVIAHRMLLAASRLA